MKILVLRNAPTDLNAYDRNLRSKVHNELRKHIDIQHNIYIFKEFKNLSFSRNIKIDMPFKWRGVIRKIAGVIFIVYNNIKLIKNIKADLIMLEMANGLYDFPMFFYPILFPKRKFFIETSTPAVNKSKIIRTIIDTLLSITLIPYKHVGCGNPSTADKLKIPSRKIVNSKLGFPEYSYSKKEFDTLNLIYLGTLFNRDVWKTVIGLKIFKDKNPDVKITYDIVGGAKEPEVVKLKETIKDTKLNDIVTYHGFQSTDFVNKIFLNCNVGIAFVPIVEYYDKVSTTKAVEYLLAGMPVIATKTTFASGLIKPEAGVLCKDTPEDFAQAIEQIWLNKETYDSEKIRDIYSNLGLSHVIKTQYVPLLKSLAEMK